MTESVTWPLTHLPHKTSEHRLKFGPWDFSGAWSLKFGASTSPRLADTTRHRLRGTLLVHLRSNWLPLCLLPIGAMSVRNLFPGWVFMWLLALAIFFGCKWLSWREAKRRGSDPGIARSMAYFFAWPGMDATAF